MVGDLAPTFTHIYPEILEPYISKDDFWEIIQKINDTLEQAFNPLGFRAWLDAFMGVATFWLWDDAGLTKVKKDLANLNIMPIIIIFSFLGGSFNALNLFFDEFFSI